MPASDHYWRPLGMMHKVFAGSAIVLFASTIIMMVVDEDREWRYYQARAEQLRYEKLREESGEFSEEQYQERLAELIADEEAAKEAIEDVQTQIDELKVGLDAVRAQVERLQRESKDKNADRDVARANYDLGIRDALPDGELQQLRLAFDAAQETALDFARQLEAALTSRDEIQAELDAFEESVATATTELADFQFEQEQIQEQMNLLQPENWFSALKRRAKTWPILNGFDPEITLQDKQDWIPGPARSNWEWRVSPASTVVVPATYTLTNLRLVACRRFRTGSARTETTRIPSHPIRGQTCSSWTPARTPRPTSAVRSAMTGTAREPAFRPPSTRRTTRTRHISGKKSTAGTRITSGSTRCSPRSSLSRPV